jgi:hypothetical protein
MADEQDRNPMDAMFPDGDNPEYHRKKAEHEERLGSEAENAALESHPYLAERLTGQRVRNNPPQAEASVPPPPRPEHLPPEEPTEGTGLVVEAPVPQAPAPQAPAAPVAAPVVPPQPVPTTAPVIDMSHPLLKKLRQDFGIEAIPLEEVKIGTHVFTLRVLDGGAVTTAVRFADAMSIGARENELNLQTCLTSFAVVAIDGEPLWEVMEIPLEMDERIFVEGAWKAVFDPKSPPDRVRMMASTKFMDFLSKEATMDLGIELWTQYKTKVDPKGSIESLLGEAAEEEDIDLPLS